MGAGRVIRVWPQGVAAGFLDFAAGFGFAGPVQLVVLGRRNALLAQEFFEFFDVDLVVAQHFGGGLAQQGQQFVLALGQCVWAVAEFGEVGGVGHGFLWVL